MTANQSEFLSGGGEMGAALRRLRADDTPLGAPESWPTALRTLVGVMLASNQPMFIAWGTQRTLLYNDGYIDILGGKHPNALGRPLIEVWHEIEAELSPIVESTFAGIPTQMDDITFTLHRNGYPEEAHFSFFYSPVRGAGGDVEGLFCGCNEITAQVFAKRNATQSLERLEQLFDQAPGFMAVTRGPTHVYELVNQSLTRIVAHRDVLGKPIREALPELEGQGFFELLDNVYRTGETYVGRGLPIQLQPAPGADLEQRYVDFVYQPVFGTAGEVTGIFIQGSDVTDSKTVEERLRDGRAEALHMAEQIEVERRRLDALLEAAPVGIGYAGPDGALIDVNSANRDIWGEHPMSESVDEYIEWKGWWADGSARHGDRVEADQWPIARALRGETVRDAIVEIQPFDRPDTRKTIQIQARPVLAADGSLIGGVFAQIDITHAVGMQARLRESEARFRALADSIPQLAWMADATGHISWYNDRWYEFTGTTPDQMVGWGWKSVHDPAHVERVEAKYRAHVESGAPWEDTFPLRSRDGEYRWFLSRAVPVRDESGGVQAWFGTNTDVTDQRRAEEDLRDAASRKDEFLAMLAHELRNPLAPIGTAAHLLRLAPGDDRQIEHAADVIGRQVSHLTSLVDDLLDVSRVTRGLVVIERQPVDLRSVVAAAVEQVRPLIQARGHELRTAITAGPFMVEGDFHRLVQVVANILHNAAKYTPQNGRVEIRVHLESDHVVLRIADDGIGMDSRLLPRVFDLFTQAERTPDRAQGGLGIGLALVRSIVALHGGTVEAASEGLNLGSTFTLRLPQAIRVVPQPQKVEQGGATASRRVLIVDDNVDAAETLADVLRVVGHDVRIAVNGADGIIAAREGNWDVFILDIGLPDMTGLELSDRLHRETPNPRAIYVALTGYGQPHDRVLSKAAGFDHHMVKPPDIPALLSLLERTASSRPDS